MSYRFLSERVISLRRNDDDDDANGNIIANGMWLINTI